LLFKLKINIESFDLAYIEQSQNTQMTIAILIFNYNQHQAKALENLSLLKAN